MDVRSWSPGTPGSAADGRYAEAAFRVGEVCERAGDLWTAAQWFREAAEAGRPGARLRLGAVLGRLADSLADRPDAGTPDPGVLLAEAARWLTGSPEAATPAGIGLITDMLNRQQRQAARRALENAAPR
ncbi:hypothetical protein [Actinomadura rayongensis]|uniref:Tetratricopeptide repeat protein n=1 Tax=Actinomadura rayongensis TaxID=1429076 RepID=A0A6I4W8N7_9ACTN|nr:hypothetical protein [Actinomadura rayongensis]MXQ63444.1 hypothetical protein [Actinomadura rayongensis]